MPVAILLIVFQAVYCTSLYSLAAWSSGMILASGTRGPGFNSRSSPWSPPTLLMLSNEMCSVAQHARELSHPLLHLLLLVPRALLATRTLEKRRGKRNGGVEWTHPASDFRTSIGAPYGSRVQEQQKKTRPKAQKYRKRKCSMPSC